MCTEKPWNKESEFFGNIINAHLSDSCLKSCMSFAENHIACAGEQMIHLLNAREQNEKAMMASFADTESQEGKWEAFLLRSNSNARIMDVLRQFHFEIRSLLASIKGAALKFPQHHEIEETLKRQFIDPKESEKYLKILLGFQEEASFTSRLKFSSKTLIDLWMIRWGNPADTAFRRFNPGGS